MIDEPQNEEVHTTDRRRFTPDGELRADAPDTDDAPVVEVIEADLVPAAEARMWEQRARAAESKLAELADALRRGRAETEAVRSRLERDQATRVREALGRSFGQVLVALDNLERALEHAGDSPLADGVRLVQRQILDALAAEGLERIEVLGLPFDPNVAEAVATCPAATPEQASTVVAEIRAGYRLGDRIVRPAQVQVAMG
jgi:molecular chaperone GrpE